MSVTFAPGCYDVDDPVDPDWDSIEEEDFDALTGHYPGGWEAEPRFRVATETVERAADVLLVVANRFMRVGQSGTEYDAWQAQTDRDPTPSFAGVSIDHEAAYVWAHTSEWLSHAMAATMKRILWEELAGAGILAVVSEDYNPSRGIAAQRWLAR